MQLHVFQNTDAVCRALAGWIVAYCAEVVRERGQFSVVLSGGNTPKHLFELLASDEFRSHIAWETWRVFWGDERVVPFTDERNNARMAYDALLKHVPIPTERIHVMRTDEEPEHSAAAYEFVLRRLFDQSSTTFDLVLLGLGDDGHTLSLFPGTDVVEEETAWVRAFFLEKQAMYRLTLTAPVINRAASVAFLVTGESKASVLNEVLNGPTGQFPAQRIQPRNGNLHWFLDEAAANELPKK